MAIYTAAPYRVGEAHVAQGRAPLDYIISTWLLRQPPALSVPVSQLLLDDFLIHRADARYLTQHYFSS